MTWPRRGQGSGRRGESGEGGRGDVAMWRASVALMLRDGGGCTHLMLSHCPPYPLLLPPLAPVALNAVYMDAACVDRARMYILCVVDVSSEVSKNHLHVLEAWETKTRRNIERLPKWEAGPNMNKWSVRTTKLYKPLRMLDIAHFKLINFYIFCFLIIIKYI